MLNEKAKRGRPPKALSGESGRMIGFRASPTLRRQIEQAARRAGQTLSDWLRIQTGRASR